MSRSGWEEADKTYQRPTLNGTNKCNVRTVFSSAWSTVTVGTSVKALMKSSSSIAPALSLETGGG